MSGIDNEFSDFEVCIDADDARESFLETGNPIFIWEAFNILTNASQPIPDWITNELLNISNRILNATDPKRGIEPNLSNTLGIGTRHVFSQFYKHKTRNIEIINKLNILLHRTESEAMDWINLEERNPTNIGFSSLENAYENLADEFNVDVATVKRLRKKHMNSKK